MIEARNPRELRSAIRRTERMANRPAVGVYFRDDQGRDWLIDRVYNSTNRRITFPRIILKGRLAGDGE